MSKQEDLYIQRCMQLASLGKGQVAPNPLVGSVLVYNDHIIGEGFHQHYGKSHAEVNCIASVKPSNQHLIERSTIYVSLEPCAHFGKTPPCADLIIRNKIPKVVIGCRDPFKAVDGKGIEKLKKAGIDVQISGLSKDCIFQNRRFFTFHKKKRPYIILKWAQTQDGFIAYKNQQKENRLLISNAMANREVHRWRNEESAILIGTNTALLDNPSLTNRLWSGKSPIRLVIDKKGKIPSDALLFDQKTKTIIFTSIKMDSLENIQYIYCDPSHNYIQQILRFCYENQIQSILVEGGQQLLQSFINEDLWDEVRIIYNKELVIYDGLKAPEFLNRSTSIAKNYLIDNNEVEILYHSHLNDL